MAKKSTNRTPVNAARLLRFAPALLGFAIYALLSVNHGFVLDDNLVITSNQHVQDGFAGIPELLTTNYTHGHEGFNDGLYRPLSLVSFAIEESLFGLNPALSHLLQALLYGLCIWVLYRWLLELLGTGSKWPFWISLVFALHPIHTEVVANLKSRDELLALLFFLLALIPFTRWMQRKDWKFLFFSACWFLLALFSKESAVTYLAAFPMLLWMQKIPVRQGAMATGLLALPAGLFLAIRTAVLMRMGPVDEGITSLLQNSLLQASGLLDRLAGAAYIQWMYIAKLFLPFELSHDYSYSAIPFHPWDSLPGLASLLGVLALAGIGVFGFVNRKWYGFGILLYFALVSVVSNAFILIGATAAERFLFSPSLGWSFVAVAAFTSTPFLRKWSVQTLSAYCALFALLTILRIPDWESNFALFKADVKKVSNSARAHYNYGSALIEQASQNPGQRSALLSEAQEHLYESIEIYPDYQDAYNNLGIAFMNDQRLEEAIETYKNLLERFPGYSKGHYNLANASFKLQRYAQAEKHFEEFYTNNPDALDALYMAAECEGFQQKFEEAIAHLQALVNKEPQRARGWIKLGIAHASLGRLGEASQYLNRALQIAPENEDARLNLALVHANSGNPEAAVRELEIILSQNPQNQRAAQMLSTFRQGTAASE